MPSSIFYTLGITEHTCGTENVQNLANLAMLCGQIGKESSGVNPLRGQNNVQGACDMGALHSALPGYQRVSAPVVREKFEKAWGVTLPTHVGGRVTDFVQQAGAGILKGFFCMGEDPVLSEPNSTHVSDCLMKLEFIVCQEIFMSETAKLAHVILLATRRGQVVVRAHVARKVRPGVVWMPFHFVESSTNLLTNNAFDTVTKTGEYKACAARLEKA